MLNPKVTTPAHLTDFDHPTIQNLAARLTVGKADPVEKLERLFYYVRDEIKFGFPPTWDTVPASETVYYGIGTSSTKTLLFVSLCRASGINARPHFGLIDAGILHGIMPSFTFPILPKLVVHSWAEVQLDGSWKPIDTYIDDKPFYDRVLSKLEKSGRQLGYSIAYQDGKSSCELNFGEKGFVCMGAVREDLGAWEEADHFYASAAYPRLTGLQRSLMPMLSVMANRNIARLRQL